MAAELTHIVRDCPICGRPVEIQTMYVGHEVLCGHCRGSFVVFRATNGHLEVTACRSPSLLERAGQLLDRPETGGSAVTRVSSS